MIAPDERHGRDDEQQVGEEETPEHRGPYGKKRWRAMHSIYDLPARGTITPFSSGSGEPDVMPGRRDPTLMLPAACRFVVTYPHVERERRDSAAAARYREPLSVGTRPARVAVQPRAARRVHQLPVPPAPSARSAASGCAPRTSSMPAPILEGIKKTMELLATGPDERPLSVQIFGANAEEMAGAAKWLVERGLADGIDINMGCPVRKVVRTGGGSAHDVRHDRGDRRTRAQGRRGGAGAGHA